MASTARRIRLALLASGLFVCASCQDPAPRTNPFRLVSVGGVDDFDVTSDGRVVVASTGWTYGSSPGVEIVDPDTLVVTPLSSDQSFFVDVEADDAYVSWSGVRQVPLAGGATNTLAGPWNPDSRLALVADPTYLFAFATSPSTGAIHRREHATGTSVTLISSTDVWGGPVGDATHIYWITYARTVARILKLGGTIETVFDLADHSELGTGQLWALAIDQTHVYVGLDAAVLRFSKADRTVEVIATNQVLAQAVAVDASHVYWVRGHANRFVDYPGECDVVRRALAGGPEQVIARGQNGVSRIAFARGRVIWNEYVPADLASVRLDSL